VNSSSQQIRQNGGFADVGVLGGGAQRQCTGVREAPQVVDCRGSFRCCQLGAIAAAELCEPLRVMGTPGPQLG
jgi:hypothetical protein